METQQTSAMPFEKGLTFEKVWAALMETRAHQAENARQMREQVKETDRLLREQARETDRQLREQAEETNRQLNETALQMKATNKLVGELSNRFGDIVEHMILPKLDEKFNLLGFTFSQAGNRVIKDRENNIFIEIDIFLENGESAMLVELKAKPNVSHVDDHVERMEKMREYADLHNDRRSFYGAFGGAIMSEAVRIYALKKGFYIIEQSGDTITVTKPRGSYAPKVW
jgi:hypothetical protein